MKLGALKLHVIPLSVSIEGMTIGESPRFPSSLPFATANNVKAKLQLFPLLHGEPVVDSLSMSRPAIELIRDANGVWNVSTLGTGGSGTGGRPFTLKKLTIDDGQVGVTDPRASSRELSMTISISACAISRRRASSTSNWQRTCLAKVTNSLLWMPM